MPLQININITPIDDLIFFFLLCKPNKTSNVFVNDTIKTVQRQKNSDSKDIYNSSNNLLKSISHTFLISSLYRSTNVCQIIKAAPNLSNIKKDPKNLPQNYLPISGNDNTQLIFLISLIVLNFLEFSLTITYLGTFRLNTYQRVCLEFA